MSASSSCFSSTTTFRNIQDSSELFPPKLFALFNAYELLPEPLLCLALPPHFTASLPSTSLHTTATSFSSASAIAAATHRSSTSHASFAKDCIRTSSASECPTSPPPPYSSSFISSWMPCTPPDPSLSSKLGSVAANDKKPIPFTSRVVYANTAAQTLFSKFLPATAQLPFSFASFLKNCISSVLPTLPSANETLRCTLTFAGSRGSERDAASLLYLEWSSRWVPASVLEDPTVVQDPSRAGEPSGALAPYLLVTLNEIQKTTVCTASAPETPERRVSTSFASSTTSEVTTNAAPSTLTSPLVFSSAEPASVVPLPRRASVSVPSPLSPSTHLFPPSYFHANFHIEKLLGRGSFGAVYQCTHRIDGQRYAVKLDITLVPFPSTHSMDRVLREVKTFASVSTHPNILRYFHTWIEHNPLDGVVPSSQRRSSFTASHYLSASSSSFDFLQDESSHPELKSHGAKEPNVHSAVKNQRFVDEDDVAEEDPNEEEDEEDDEDEDESFSDALPYLSTYNPMALMKQDDDNPSFRCEEDIMAEDPTFHHVWATRSLACSSPSPMEHRRRQSTNESFYVNTPSHVPSCYLPIHPGWPSVMQGYPSPPLSVFSSRSSHRRRSESASTPFLLIQMECPEVTLKSFLKNRTQAIPVTTAVAIWRDIALGLAHLHARGYVHCDLSSSNIFLNTLPQRASSSTASSWSKVSNEEEKQEYQVLLGDFGLSVPIQEPAAPSSAPFSSFFSGTTDASSSSSFSSMEEVSLGTPIYMGPEYHDPHRPTASPSLDIYAMAILLLELLFFFHTRMERAAVLMRFKQHCDLPASNALDPHLVALLLRCGAHDPAQRPTAMEIYLACCRFLHQEPSGLTVCDAAAPNVPHTVSTARDFANTVLPHFANDTVVAPAASASKDGNEDHAADDDHDEDDDDDNNAPSHRHFAYSLRDAESFVREVQMDLDLELNLLTFSNR